jgi:hypothetical protein
MQHEAEEETEEPLACERPSELKKQQQTERRKPLAHKPDPLFKAKQIAKQRREERNRKHQAIENKIKMKETKIVERKKRHVKLSLRTKTGQPVIKNQIKDILYKLQKTEA